MKQNLEMIGLLLSISANIIGFLVWYNSSQQKRFAAQEAFRRIDETNQEILKVLESQRQKQIEMHQSVRDKLDLSLNTFNRESQTAQNTIVGQLKELEMIINVLIIKLTDSSISDIIKGKNRNPE